jgi:hypothetical protein
MIRAASPSEIESVCGKLPLPYCPAMRGVCNEGAMVLYDSWTPNACQVHVYSRGPHHLLNRKFLTEVFTYGFIQCDKGKLFTVTPAHATESLKVSDALGFRESYRQIDGWAKGVDMVYKEMLREDCRYLRMH